MTAHTRSAFVPVLSALSVARILWKHRVLVPLVAIAGSGLAVAVVHRLPAVYRSEALILVDSQKIPERYVSATVNTEVQDRLATITQQILSRRRLLAIINNFGLYERERKAQTEQDIIELMRKDITIKLEKGWSRERPGAFRVGYQGHSPALVTEVANQLANLFINENVRTRELQAEGTAEFIESQLQEAKNTLDVLEAKVGTYKLKHKGELPEQELALIGTLNRLQVELQGNQDAINRAELHRTIIDSALRAAESQDEMLSKAKKKSEVLAEQYEQLIAQYRPAHPKLKALAAEIERQKTAEAAEAIARHQPVENLKTELATVDQELATRNGDRTAILSAITSNQAHVDRLPVREQEMASLTRDYEISKANYKSLLDKKLAASMATDMERKQQAERFTLLDPARIPERPVSPKRRLLYAIGLIFGFGLALALAFFSEFQKNVVLGEWELPAGVIVLGRVPLIRPGQSPSEASRGSRWPLISSAGLSILVVLGLGLYFYIGQR